MTKKLAKWIFIFLISFWMMSSSLSFGVPISPFLALLFIIISIWEKRYELKSLNIFSPFKQKTFLLLALNYLLFLLILGITRDIDKLSLSSLFRGTIFLSCVYIALLFSLVPTREDFKRLCLWCGGFISILGLGKIIYVYIAIPSEHWDVYTSSLSSEVNYFNFPILIGLWCLVSHEKTRFIRDSFLITLMSSCVYLSGSRRAFVILALMFLISLFTNGFKKKRIKLLLVLILFSIIPIKVLPVQYSFFKTMMFNLTGQVRHWDNFSTIYEYRYLKIFGLNRTRISLIDERRELKMIPWLKFRASTNSSGSDWYFDKEAPLYEGIQQQYDTGGRLERWDYGLVLFRKRSLVKQLFGDGFSYHYAYKNHFNKEVDILGYPHLIGFSVLLYSGVIGGFLFLLLLLVSVLRLIKMKDYLLLGISTIIYLMSSISLNIPFESYIVMISFALPLLANSKRQEFSISSESC